MGLAPDLPLADSDFLPEQQSLLHHQHLFDDRHNQLVAFAVDLRRFGDDTSDWLAADVHLLAEQGNVDVLLRSCTTLRTATRPVSTRRLRTFACSRMTGMTTEPSWSSAGWEASRSA